MPRHQRMGYDAMGPGLAGATKEMVMSENRRDGAAEKELAREIFTRAMAARIGAGQKQLNTDAAAYEAFESARAFFKIEQSRSPAFQVTQQHLDEAGGK